ncbi:MAG: hypothetical protein RJA07_658 [Bacteroidota bacterium]|jgi:hypothetical protein
MKKYIPILTILLMLATIACRHRYEDDNYYSLRNPGKRLLGNWKIVAFNVDGADSLADLFKRTNYADCTFNSVYDKNYHVGKWTGCIDIWTYPGYFSADFKYYMWSDFFIHPVSTRNTNTQPDYKSFYIEKLYKSDWWISIDMDGKHYEIKFKKQ